ncbi:MAG: hypothetical protein ACTSU9_00710 [Promethearchaeota archaeon]
MISVIYNLASGNAPPAHLLVILAAVLAYYGLFAKEVLPEKLYREVPAGFGKNIGIPGIKEATGIIEDKLDEVVDYVAGVKTLACDWFASTLGSAVDSIVETKKAVLNLSGKIKEKLSIIADFTGKFTIKVGNRFEQFAIIVLLFGIILFNTVYVASLDGLPIEIITGASLGIFSIISGKDIKGFISNKL